MSVPFTQYLLPDGRRTQVLIDMPEEVEGIARRFIASGGRYECEILTTGDVSITKRRGEEGDVAIAVCPNGPEVPANVDKVVRESEQYIGAE